MTALIGLLCHFVFSFSFFDFLMLYKIIFEKKKSFKEKQICGEQRASREEGGVVAPFFLVIFIIVS